MKQTEIEYCGDCPHRYYDENEMYCEKENKKTWENNKCPEWCPLSDVVVRKKHLNGGFHNQVRNDIGAGLKSCIRDHGPITPEHIGSAKKRIYANIKMTINRLR